MKSRNVLIVAYEYPPLQVGGVARTKLFSEELVKAGWATYVLTPQRPYGVEAKPNSTHATEVIRTSGLELYDIRSLLVKVFRWFGYSRTELPPWLAWRIDRCFQFLTWPDAHAGWAWVNIPFAIFLVFRKNIEIVYTTSWPYSDHLMGLIVAKIARRPWVADFRDPFVRHFNYGVPSRVRDALNKWLERMVCEHAACVINPTNRATNQMRSDYPDIDADKFVTIRNGFDEAEFTGGASMRSGLNFLHSGALYLSRRPDSFLEALQDLVDAGEIDAEDLSVTFMGGVQEEGLDIKAYEHRFKFVSVLGMKPRPVSIQAIRTTQVLLLIRHPECSLTIPGKVYEYMASGNHILAITGNEDELDDIFSDYPNHTTLRNPSRDSILEALRNIIGMYRRSELARPIPASVENFSRQLATKRLSTILNRLCHDSMDS